MIELRLALISYQDYHILLLTLAGTPGGSCANSDPTLKTIGTLVSNASCQSHRTSVKAVRSICVGLPACRLVVSTTKDTSAFDGKHFQRPALCGALS